MVTLPLVRAARVLHKECPSSPAYETDSKREDALLSMKNRKQYGERYISILVPFKYIIHGILTVGPST